MLSVTAFHVTQALNLTRWAGLRGLGWFCAWISRRRTILTLRIAFFEWSIRFIIIGEIKKLLQMMRRVDSENWIDKEIKNGSFLNFEISVRNFSYSCCFYSQFQVVFPGHSFPVRISLELRVCTSCRILDKWFDRSWKLFSKDVNMTVGKSISGKHLNNT